MSGSHPPLNEARTFFVALLSLVSAHNKEYCEIRVIG